MPTKHKRKSRLHTVDYPNVYMPHNFANNETLFYKGESAEESVAKLKAMKRADVRDEISEWSEEDWSQYRLAFRLYAIKAVFEQGIASWLKFMTDDELDMVLANFLAENRRIAAVVKGNEK